MGFYKRKNDLSHGGEGLMKKADISYLILHYKNIDDTIKCVESIEITSKNNSYFILIVDNGSGNGTGEKLEEIYYDNPYIYILKTEKNLGFSGGNNIGYEYIRNNIETDYIVVTNNDIIFHQDNFFQMIHDIFQENHFYVLGPDIYVRRNMEHQSPIMLSSITSYEARKELQMYKYYQQHLRKYVLRRKFQNIKNNLYSNHKYFQYAYNKIKKKKTINYNEQYENVVLQGACIIFSTKFIEKEDILFTPAPFLYCEEHILQHRCMRSEYKMIYDPRIRVWHEDSASITKSFANAVLKAEFTLKHHVLARRVLVDYIENSQKLY